VNNDETMYRKLDFIVLSDFVVLLSQNIMYFILKSLHDDRVQHYVHIYFFEIFKFDIFTSKMEKNTASVEPELHLEFSVKSVLYAKVSS
jgi:hypothetical protein